MSLSLIQAAPVPISAPRELTAIVNIPAGAKTVVTNMDGQTQVEALLPHLKTLVIRVVASAEGPRYSYRMASDGSTSELVNRSGANLVSPLTPPDKRTFTPPLNEWLPLWTAQIQSAWVFQYGNKKIPGRETITVKVLFTEKPSEKVSRDLQPPQKP